MADAHKQCKCCGNDASNMMYMYRDLKGQSVFTGFVKKGNNIVWIGKDEKSLRPIIDEEDRQFFLQEMSQYDK